MKKCLVYLLIIFITNLCFLFSPEPQNKEMPAGHCKHSYVRLNKYMGFPMSCDAVTFMRSAVDPSYLLQPGFIRQSRPLYVIMGTVVSYFVYYITYPFHNWAEKHLRQILSQDFSDNELKKSTLYLSSYIGFILINATILLISFFLFEKIVKQLSGPWKNGRVLFILFLLMLASNQLTKSFFWTAHQQIFNILTPLLCVYTGIKIVKAGMSPGKILLLSFTGGLLLLVYGNSLLLLTTILFCFVFTAKKNWTSNKIRIVIMSLLMIILFFLPAACWILLLKSRGVDFFSSEITEFRQFVWITDAIRDPGKSFFHELYINSVAFIKTFGSLFFSMGLLFIVSLHKKIFFSKIPVPEAGKSVSSIQTFLFRLIIFEFFLFFWLLGYYADRLTFSIAPLFLCLAALIINQNKIGKNLKWLLIIILLVFHLYTIFFDAPHFSDRFFY